MTTYRASDAAWSCDGTSALEANEPCHLVLLEGGLSNPRYCREEPEIPAKASWRSTFVGLVACVVLVAMLDAAFVVADARTASRMDEALETFETQTIVVHEGDTLWAIASEHAQDGYSTNEIVSWIEETNGLENATIIAGQTLVVPLSESE